MGKEGWGEMFLAFLKVLCPQKSFDQNTDKVSSSWGRTQCFGLGNKQPFYLLNSDVSLLSVDLKSQLTTQTNRFSLSNTMFKIDDLTLYKDANLSSIISFFQMDIFIFFDFLWY